MVRPAFMLGTEQGRGPKQTSSIAGIAQCIVQFCHEIAWGRDISQHPACIIRKGGFKIVRISPIIAGMTIGQLDHGDAP